MGEVTSFFILQLKNNIYSLLEYNITFCTTIFNLSVFEVNAKNQTFIGITSGRLELFVIHSKNLLDLKKSTFNIIFKIKKKLWYKEPLKA